MEPSVPPPPRPGRAEADDEAAVGYGAVAAAHAALAAAMLLQPSAVADFLVDSALVGPSADAERLLGLLAATLCGAAGAAWGLKGAAEEGALETAAADRVQLGLAAFGAAAFGVHLAHGGHLAAPALGVGAAAAALTLGVPAARMLGTERGRGRLGAYLRRSGDSIANLFSFPRGFTLTSALYAGLTPVLAIAGVAGIFAPEWMMSNVLGIGRLAQGRDAVFVKRAAGAALATLAPAVTSALKDKADAGRLGEPLPKALNAGLLAAAAAHVATLAPISQEGSGGQYLPAALGVWTAAGAAALLGLAAGAAK